MYSVRQVILHLAYVIQTFYIWFLPRLQVSIRDLCGLCVRPQVGVWPASMSRWPPLLLHCQARHQLIPGIEQHQAKGRAGQLDHPPRGHPMVLGFPHALSEKVSAGAKCERDKVRHQQNTGSRLLAVPKFRSWPHSEFNRLKPWFSRQQRTQPQATILATLLRMHTRGLIPRQQALVRFGANRNYVVWSQSFPTKNCWPFLELTGDSAASVHVVRSCSFDRQLDQDLFVLLPRQAMRSGCLCQLKLAAKGPACTLCLARQSRDGMNAGFRVVAPLRHWQAVTDVTRSLWKLCPAVVV